MATWLVIERRIGKGPGGEPIYDVERNGRAFAYDVASLQHARSRIIRSRRFDKAADRVILVNADGGRSTLVQRGHV